MHLGLDIGGTSLKLGAWDGQQRLAWQDGIPVPSGSVEAIADAVARVCREQAATLDSAPHALGIGSCGMISHGVILHSPNTPWDHLPLAELLYSRLDYPVHLINDADAFLIDALDVLDERPACVIGITLGTGVGTAFWLHGKLLAGGSGISPEGGHITLKSDGALANTGIPGSWESLACRDSVLRYYEEAGGTGAADPKAIAGRAADGEAAALAAWHRYGAAVGAGLGSLCNLFTPQYVLIGGGLAGAHALYADALQATLRRHMLRVFELPRLEYLAERADCVARGAARYAMSRSK
jgi:glucokinase